MIGIPEVTETTRETRDRLNKKDDQELIKFMIDVDQSIKAGFEHAIYFQEWSVAHDILRSRGYEIFTTKDLYNLRR